MRLGHAPVPEGLVGRGLATAGCVCLCPRVRKPVGLAPPTVSRRPPGAPREARRCLAPSLVAPLPRRRRGPSRLSAHRFGNPLARLARFRGRPAAIGLDEDGFGRWRAARRMSTPQGGETPGA
jgi:hypothetical protein